MKFSKDTHNSQYIYWINTNVISITCCWIHVPLNINCKTFDLVCNIEHDISLNASSLTEA